MTTLDLITDFFARADQKFFDSGPFDQAITLCRAFAGCELRIPQMAEIEREERKEYITRTLMKDASQRQMAFLVDRYGQNKRYIAKIMHKASGIGLKKIRENMAASAAGNQNGD